MTTFELKKYNKIREITEGVVSYSKGNLAVLLNCRDDREFVAWNTLTVSLGLIPWTMHTEETIQCLFIVKRVKGKQGFILHSGFL